jgi:hypothetical protein
MNKQQYKKATLPVWLLGLIAFVVFCNTVAATGVEAQTKTGYYRQSSGGGELRQAAVEFRG